MGRKEKDPKSLLLYEMLTFNHLVSLMWTAQGNSTSTMVSLAGWS